MAKPHCRPTTRSTARRSRKAYLPGHLQDRWISTLSVADAANSALTASANTSVTTSAQQVIFSGLGQSATAGTAQNVTVTVADNFGNVITGYAGTLHFTSSDSQAVLPVDYTFTRRRSRKTHFPDHLQDYWSRSLSVLRIRPTAHYAPPPTLPCRRHPRFSASVAWDKMRSRALSKTSPSQ